MKKHTKDFTAVILIMGVVHMVIDKVADMVGLALDETCFLIF